MATNPEKRAGLLTRLSMGSPSGYTVCSWSGRATSVLLWCAGHSSFTDASMHTRAPTLPFISVSVWKREREREQRFGQLPANTLSFSFTVKEKSSQEQFPTAQRWTLENEYMPDIQLNLTKDFCGECQFDVCFFSTLALRMAKGFCFRWVQFSAYYTSGYKRASSSSSVYTLVDSNTTDLTSTQGRRWGREH